MIALDYKFLKQIYEEIKKNEPAEDNNEDENPYKSLIFYLVYPNHKQESPFDIAIKNNSPKCVDLMLQMLIEVPEYRVSHFIKSHFSTLFTMKLGSFEGFLESCLFTNLPMINIKAINWKSSKNEVFLDYHTSFIASDFQYKIFKETQNFEEEEVIQPVKKVITSELSQYDSQLYDSDQVKDLKHQKKRIEVTAVEFDWIFHGKDSHNFIKRLAETENDNLFLIPAVRVIILFLWQKYFYRIVYYLFFPFLLYLISFCFYATLSYEKKAES